MVHQDAGKTTPMGNKGPTGGASQITAALRQMALRNADEFGYDTYSSRGVGRSGRKREAVREP